MIERTPSGEPENSLRPASNASRWGALSGYVGLERRIARAALRNGRLTRFAYEFVRFGLKQAWACLFGGLMLALLVATHLYYPAGALLARYDFLVLAALAIQAGMLAFKLETWEEAKVILAFHVVVEPAEEARRQGENGLGSGAVLKSATIAGSAWSHDRAHTLRRA